jgi:DNA-binding NarL/FixJ family response regulator
MRKAKQSLKYLPGKSAKGIAVVDDHNLFRNGLASLLRESGELEVIMQASDGKDLLKQLKLKQPQLILLDIRMPVMDGTETLCAVKEKYPDIKIIMLSQFHDEATIYHFLEKGANSFLPKETEIEILVSAIHSVLEKGYYYTEKVQSAISKGNANKHRLRIPQNICTLSDREIEVARYICKQMSIKEIAEKMYLSPRTIDTYIENIYSKTGARKTAGIVFYAIEHKLLE